MIRHLLVCPLNEELISGFKGEALVVRTGDVHSIRHIWNIVNEKNKMHCIQLVTNNTLSGMPFDEYWDGIPIHLFVPRFGIFKEFISKLPCLRKLSIRVFLSSDLPENYQCLQILASLGVDGGLYFGIKPPDWKEINDLMHYSIYGKAPHATLEPFQYIVSHYNPKELTNFGSVYFDNPERYLHLNEEGHVALSSGDMEQGNFIQKKFNFDELIRMDAYSAYIKRWQEFFLSDHVCAKCPSWRVCIGKFSHHLDNGFQCQEFFNDMMEAAEFFAANRSGNKAKELCQL